jgi:hypothetical protein
MVNGIYQLTSKRKYVLETKNNFEINARKRKIKSEHFLTAPQKGNTNCQPIIE